MKGIDFMNEAIVRLESIIIENFKNVSYGKIDLTCKNKNYKANILGLYGQNGSGKTALIDALTVLQITLKGQSANYRLADMINVNCEIAHLTYKFSITKSNSDEVFHVIYSLFLKRAKNDYHSDKPENNFPYSSYRAIIFNEQISFSYCKNGVIVDRMKPMIDLSSTSIPFGPKQKYETIIGKNKEFDMALFVAKKVAETMSMSFAFSKELLTIINKNCSNENYKFIMNSLIHYGNYELFVFDTASNANITFNILPISVNIKNNNQEEVPVYVNLPIDGNGAIPDEAFDIVKNSVNNMNIVLNQLVPGLTIGIKKLGSEMIADGKIATRIQLLSLKNGKEIPLCYESEGIKKIVAILQLLIGVYNKPSITVAIDELDSGMFEYLLGEILKIISEKGKGQLIFTSHNLRPLETLDKSFIAFTTTNPDNRYIRLTNVKSTNNLRDFYYRDITLGEQSEHVYEATNNHEIAFAFKEAGECYGS